MVINIKKIVFAVFVLQLGCHIKPTEVEKPKVPTQDSIPSSDIKAPLLVGAARVGEYLPLLGKQGVAIVVNQTSMIGNTHLLDTLLALGVQVKGIFAPEHGFRGEADAGEKINSTKDTKTGLPLYSLYGATKKPAPETLKDVDWVVFDIQDVGARFYTYISTMHYVMEACAEQGKRLMVLDRPNPNGHYVDGPILDMKYHSFIGMHPVPIVHGMTIGEYAQMINGEGWMEDSLKCNLTVIPCANYTHQTPYELPVKPSPNLPNSRAIYLYPSICLFEGTVASVGRGTDSQFQVYGHPDYSQGTYTFTPLPKPGAMHPLLEGKTCKGYDLTGLDPASIRAEARINLGYIINFYKNFPHPKDFFLANGFFNKLAGNETLRQQIESGLSEEEIRKSWQEGVEAFKNKRKKYLLYAE